MGALKLSNLLDLDRFEEDLNISRVALYAPKPDKPAASAPASPAQPHPQDQEAARRRTLEILARFRAENGL